MVEIAVPKKIRAGDSFTFTESFSTYPATAWTATLYFTNQDNAYQFDATDSSGSHVFARTASETAAYEPGRYRWFVRVVNQADNEQSVTIGDGWTEVLPNLGDEKVDHRSHARKMFEAIEAALREAATKGQLDLISYNFGSVSVQRDREFLEKERDRYARELQREDGGDKINRRHIKMRFNKP